MISNIDNMSIDKLLIEQYKVYKRVYVLKTKIINIKLTIDKLSTKYENLKDKLDKYETNQRTNRIILYYMLFNIKRLVNELNKNFIICKNYEVELENIKYIGEELNEKYFYND